MMWFWWLAALLRRVKLACDWPGLANTTSSVPSRPRFRDGNVHSGPRQTKSMQDTLLELQTSTCTGLPGSRDSVNVGFIFILV